MYSNLSILKSYELSSRVLQFSAVQEGRAGLIPKRLVDKSQAYFWTRRWQEGEREADEDTKAGRVKSFDSADDLIKDLDQK